MSLESFQYQQDFQYTSGWDRYAPDYARLPKPGSIYNLTKHLIHEIVLRNLEDSKRPLRVLDVNCGTGNDFPFFLEKGWQITGTDGSAGMLNQAAEIYANAVERKQIELYQLQLEDWRVGHFPGDSFDLIFSVTGGFSYVDDAELLRINEILNGLLKPEGKLMVGNLNSFCLGEWLYFMLKGRTKQANRRRNGPIKVNIRGSEHTMYLRSERRLKELYGQSFQLETTLPLLAFTQPYQTGMRPGRAMIEWLELVEKRLLHPSFSRWADQVVMVCSKSPRTNEAHGHLRTHPQERGEAR